MPAIYRFFLCLLAALASVGAKPLLVAAQPGTRTTYYDATHTQRRAVYGFVLRGSDTLAHGTYRRFWRSTGTLAELGHFTNGLADSTWTRYYPAAPGQPPALARRLPMQGGQPDGPFVVLHPDGRLAQRGTFRQGQLLDSVVTRTASGQPRLLARLVAPATSSAGLAGSFRQRYSGFTAAPLRVPPFDDYPSYDNNPYPATDSGRYWQGQLSKGRLTGILTERDPDEQLRVQLLLDAEGRLRLATQYYPAAWLRYEASQHAHGLDSLPTSRRAVQWQAIGPRPYLLQTFWSVESGKAQQLSYQPIFHHQFGPKYCYPTQPPQTRPAAPPLPQQPNQVAALWANRNKATHNRLAQEAERQAVRDPQWLLGETDTLTGAYRRLRRRSTPHSDGSREVATARVSTDYNAAGAVTSRERTTRSGTVTTRDYYNNGQLESKDRAWADERRSTHREWDEHGHLLEATRTNRHEVTFTRKRDKKGHIPLFKHNMARDRRHPSHSKRHKQQPSRD